MLVQTSINKSLTIIAPALTGIVFRKAIFVLFDVETVRKVAFH